MPHFSEHKCPKCGEEMKQIDAKVDPHNSHRRVWDLGLTGSGVTTTTTTSGSGYPDMSASLSPECVDAKRINLIPCQCSKCGYKESYRE